MTTEAVYMPASNNGNGFHAVPEERHEQRNDLLPSSYLRYLPAIYWTDSFMGRFLRIFEDILSPIQTSVSRRAEHFDPALATSAVLDLMAAWVGADEMGDLTESQKRGFVRDAVRMNQLRGTREGLRLALESVTGHRPYITEYSSGLVLGEDAVLGLNTSLQEGVPLQIHIVFPCDENDMDSALVHDIIRQFKPAETVYTVSYVT